MDIPSHPSLFLFSLVFHFSLETGKNILYLLYSFITIVRGVRGVRGNLYSLENVEKKKRKSEFSPRYLYEIGTRGRADFTTEM